MPRLNASNFGWSRLDADMLIAHDEAVVVDASSFPAAPFIILINDEFMEVTAIAGNTLSVDRGQEGTSAADHDEEDLVRHIWSAGMHDELVDTTDSRLSDDRDPNEHGNEAHDPDFEDAANKGAANGYAPLDGDSLVPEVNLPSMGLEEVTLDDIVEGAKTTPGGTEAERLAVTDPDGRVGAALTVAESMPPFTSYRGAEFYTLAGWSLHTLSSNLVGTAHRLRVWYVPIWISGTRSFDRVSVHISGATAGATMRVGLYTGSRSTGLPETLVEDAGSIDASSTGLKALVVDWDLTPGFYFLAWISSNHSFSTVSIDDSYGYSAPVSALSRFADQIATGDSNIILRGPTSDTASLASLPGAAHAPEGFGTPEQCRVFLRMA